MDNHCINKNSDDRNKQSLPLVSVICFCRNAKATIRRCIDSIQAQNYPHIEIVVQDGASDDGTLDILKSYGDAIRLVSESDNGPGYAMFSAIGRIKGDIFCCCLADEEMLPHAVSWGVQQLNKHLAAAAVYGDHYLTDIQGRITGMVRPRNWDFRKVIVSEFIPPFCASFFRRACFQAADLRRYNDCGEFEIWLRLGAQFAIFHEPGLVSKYAVHSGELSNQISHIERQAKGKRAVLEIFFSNNRLSGPYRDLKQDAVNGLQIWLAESFCNGDEWDAAYSYFVEACEVERDAERLHKTGLRLLTHGLDLVKAGCKGEARRFLQLPFQTPQAFNGFNLQKITDSYKRLYGESPSKKAAGLLTVWPATGEGLAQKKFPIASDQAPLSDLDRIIPPEIKNDALFKCLMKLAARDEVVHILEIGSSAGQGSTAAFVNALRNKKQLCHLYCLEISTPRFEQLKSYYQNDNFVHCHQWSSVGVQCFPKEDDIRRFYRTTPTGLNKYPIEQVVGWLHQDLNYLLSRRVAGDGIKKIKALYKLDHFDLVLIDGSEFTGAAELNDVYGAGIIVLDDINGYKNHTNYQRLNADDTYELIEEDWSLRNGYAVFSKKKTNLAIHFFTIVLNGMPFIRHHINEFQKLQVPWHWHIIEGVADLTHDTAWGRANGGHIPDTSHRNGLSIDGTTEYLDNLAKSHHGQITLYRPPAGRFWDGKRAMIQSIVSDLPDVCLLWQIDADELWTFRQIERMHAMFLEDQQRTAAFFHCHFFVGPRLVTITPSAYSHHDTYEWLRVWRYKAGMRWHSHEPPCLMEKKDTQWRDVAGVSAFTHDETEKQGLVFTHYAYTMEAQVRFKEDYYGYAAAVDQWRKLQKTSERPAQLKKYLAWVKDHAQADSIERRTVGRQVEPVAWHFDEPKDQTKDDRKYHVVIDGVIFQLQHKRPLGIARVWQNLLPELRQVMPDVRFTVLERRGFKVPWEKLDRCTIQTYQLGNDSLLDQDDDRLSVICASLKADLFISTYYTRAPGVKNLLLIHDMIPERFGANLEQPEWRAKTRAIETADAIATVSQCTADDLQQIHPHTRRLSPCVVTNGIGDNFKPADESIVTQWRRKHHIEKQYLLIVGNRRSYKNSKLLFDFIEKENRSDELVVVCIGGETTLTDQERNLLRNRRIQIIPYLSDDELVAAYSGATALVYLSRYEGFGLPVLEAMACGCPVIAGSAAAVLEIGSSAILKTRENNISALKQTIDQVLDPDKRQDCVRRGLDRARLFSWHKSAGLLGALIEKTCRKAPPKVSAIVTTYNCARFIRGCLEDLEAQTIADRLEIIVIDSASKEDEGNIVREFQERFDRIKYIRTDRRESIYQAWNRGIKLALSPYITNANTDDRHRRDAFEKMVTVLDEKPQVALVYGDVIKTLKDNETFDSCTPSGVLSWYDWDRSTLLAKGCFMGPQPMWRRKVHDEYGYFDERYQISADYEFWLRISQTHDFQRIPMPLGLYLERQDSIEHSNQNKKRKEDQSIADLYRRAAAQKHIPGLKPTKAIDNNLTGSSSTAVEHNSEIRVEPYPLPDTAQYALSPQGGFIMHFVEKVHQGMKCLIDNGQKEVAYWMLDKVLQDHPEHAASHHTKAVLAHENGDEAAALVHFKSAAELEPGKASYQKSLGDFFHVVQGRIEPAMAQYKKALAIDPRDIQTLMIAGHLSIALRKFDDACRYYEKALSLDPSQHEARQLLGKIKKQTQASLSPQDLIDEAHKQSQSGQKQTAIDYLERAVTAEPRNATVHNDLGVLYYETGNMQKAQFNYEKAADLEPESILFQKNLADFYYVEKGDIQKALKKYVQILTLDPQDTDALFITGHICMALENKEDAKVFFNRVLDIDPWNSKAQQMLDQLKGAFEAFRLPTQETDLYEQAQKMALSGDRQGAVNNLKKLIAQDPDHAAAYNDLGVLYYEGGDKQTAVHYYEQAARLDANNPNFMKNLADFYFIEQGRIQEALKIYIKLLETNNEDVDSLMAAGTICMTLNQQDDADIFFHRVLEIDPWNKQARERLSGLNDQGSAASEYKRKVVG